MKLKAENRIQAFALHFAASLIILLGVLFFIFEFWYPEPFFNVDGGWNVLRLIIIVHLILGPILMLIIYKPGKKGLIIDLVTIPTVQLLALIYGCSVLYFDRPVFVVFAVDRFVAVSKDDIDFSRLKFDELKNVGASGPIQVYAKLPEDMQEFAKLTFEVMQGGPDLEFRSEYYEPFAVNMEKVLRKGKAADFYTALSDDYKERIESFQKDHCKQECVYFPLIGKKQDILLAINKVTGEYVGGVEVNPWYSQKKKKADNDKV